MRRHRFVRFRDVVPPLHRVEAQPRCGGLPGTGRQGGPEGARRRSHVLVSPLPAACRLLAWNNRTAQVPAVPPVETRSRKRGLILAMRSDGTDLDRLPAHTHQARLIPAPAAAVVRPALAAPPWI